MNKSNSLAPYSCQGSYALLVRVRTEQAAISDRNNGLIHDRIVFSQSTITAFGTYVEFVNRCYVALSPEQTHGGPTLGLALMNR